MESDYLTSTSPPGLEQGTVSGARDGRHSLWQLGTYLASKIALGLLLFFYIGVWPIDML